ncbi:MAG: 3-dehydroquinate synthase [Oscillospiraceae bacterium]|nr:3-dehydroquinate synthase [Oscillospiraceae bacterium]
MIAQRVNLGNDSYEIIIDAMATFGRRIADACQPKGQIAVVADAAAYGFHGEAMAGALRAAGLSHALLALPPGEHNKTIDGLGTVYRFFAEAGLRRDGLVIAFGGGVIGDLAGFAAATWMRGVPYVQVPTTLLAQVDAGVGGKTAVNLPEGKNLVGAFYQPKLVLIDTTALDTLAPRDFRCGMAEVIKYGAIFSRKLFESLAVPPGRDRWPGIVAECCRYKADVVGRDEKESGERKLLNFGHTLGHAIEKLGGYERHTHGEAVSAGMVIAAQIGEKLGLTRAGCAVALRHTLSANGLPCDSPYKPSDLLACAEMDKKSGVGGIAFVLLRDIGTAFTHVLDMPALRELL